MGGPYLVMRIAYIALHMSAKYIFGGVGKKIQSQINLWKENGHDAHLFVHSSESMAVPNASVFPYKASTSLPILRSIFRERARIIMLRKMIQAVKDYNPDIIYLRYGMFCLPLQRLYAIAPVVVELNTLDKQEYRYRGLFYYWLNRLGRGIILSKASAFVSVSHEIAAHPTMSKFHKPVTVISNGILIEDSQILPPPQNKTPHLVFIGTTGMPWHGEDKLIWLARQYPEIHIDIIGSSRNELAEMGIPENVTCHGFLNEEEFMKVFSTSDVAVGTLALHRKQMEETSTLKIREYLRAGLPIILGCQDTDFLGKEFEFVCELPNREDNVITHAEQIREFVYSMMGKRTDISLILPLIDQRQKEKERLKFFSAILDDQSFQPSQQP